MIYKTMRSKVISILISVLSLHVCSVVPVSQQLHFHSLINRHRHEPIAAPEWLGIIDGDETGRGVPLSDSDKLLNTLLRQASSSKLGQDCKIVDVVQVGVGGESLKQAVQSLRLLTPNGMRDSIAAKLIAFAF